MDRAIHLCVKSRKVDYHHRRPYVNEPGVHNTSGNEGVFIKDGTDYILGKEDVRAKRILENIAARHSIGLVLHDLATEDGRKWAKEQGIKRTPAIIIGDWLLDTTQFTEEDVLRLLRPNV